MNAPALLRALRPAQWTKNLVVPAALVFALGDRTQSIPVAESLVAVLLATIAFCLCSSAIYLVNDVRDVEFDRLHPVKRLRPIAAGEVTSGAALAAAAVVGAGGLALAYYVATPTGHVVAGYLAIQILYSMGLKNLPLVDLCFIASGFVLRAMAGAFAVDVRISPWLLLCTFLLAMFLALCKRRHERVVLRDAGGETRTSLRAYDEKLLDQLIAIISAATVVTYSIYTLAPETVAKFGSARLGFTIPIVVLGIFRYLDLVYRHEKGGRPEQVLLDDRPLLAVIGLYGLVVGLLFTVFR